MPQREHFCSKFNILQSSCCQHRCYLDALDFLLYWNISRESNVWMLMQYFIHLKVSILWLLFVNACLIAEFWCENTYVTHNSKLDNSNAVFSNFFETNNIFQTVPQNIIQCWLESEFYYISDNLNCLFIWFRDILLKIFEVILKCKQKLQGLKSFSVLFDCTFNSSNKFINFRR